MVNRPRHINAFQFVVLSTLRAKQLLAGCTPRVEGDHNAPTMAQMEVSEGRVRCVTDGDNDVAQAERAQLATL